MDITRHLSIFSPDVAVPVHLIGAGAIGSRIFAALTELGVRDITVYDFDKVEKHNLPNQLFLDHHIGTSKVDALADWFLFKTGDNPHGFEGINFIADKAMPEDCDPSTTQVIIYAVDTMHGRKSLGKPRINLPFDKNILGIDVRMASNYGNVYSFLQGSETDQWYETLTDDETTELSPCGTSISVGVTASILSDLAVWEYIKFCNQTERAQKTNVFLNPLIIKADPWSVPDEN